MGDAQRTESRPRERCALASLAVGSHGGRCALGILLALVWLAGCSLSKQVYQGPPTLTPTATRTAVAEPTAMATGLPTVSAGPTEAHATPTVAPTETRQPSPKPLPTIDQGAVVSTIAAGEGAIAASGANVLCLRYEDVDGDQAGEWIGVVGPPTDGGRLGAFVLDGEVWHDLRPLEEGKHGLGGRPHCDLQVRDVNVDGLSEILVWGQAGESVDLLHVFVWDDDDYRLLAAFEGTAGIHLEESDGQLGEEVVVGHRAGSDLVWQVVYTWDGVAYGWTWDRHGWFYASRPHLYDTSTPERAVISFYMAVDDRDLPGAYELLSSTAKTPNGYDAWVAGFDTTLAAEASAVREIGQTADGARTVSAQVLSHDNEHGRIVANLWDVVWTVVSTDNGWRLQAVSAELLDSRELPYAP